MFPTFSNFASFFSIVYVGEILFFLLLYAFLYALVSLLNLLTSLKIFCSLDCVFKNKSCEFSTMSIESSMKLLLSLFLDNTLSFTEMSLLLIIEYFLFEFFVFCFTKTGIFLVDDLTIIFPD